MKTTREQNKILPLDRVLFTGPEQSEKLPAARLIADQLKLKLLRLDLESVIGKYIGETEKNLRRLFAQAEKSDALLFFDEADALFGKRGTVKDSHDRCSNQEVACLLRQLEAFSQPVIIATNSTVGMTAAWKKRFRTIIHFPRQPKSPPKSNEKKSRASRRR